MARKTITSDIDKRIRTLARNRCGYCLSPQHLVMARLHIEHIIPVAQGGTSDESNLWLACPICNGHKADKSTGVDPQTGLSVSLYNPREQQWHEHFRWSEDGLQVIGLTTLGRATVLALKLDSDPDALEVRSYWIAAGWHPPKNES